MRLFSFPAVHMQLASMQVFTALTIMAHCDWHWGGNVLGSMCSSALRIDLDDTESAEVGMA